jgi:hypothetical protein
MKFESSVIRRTPTHWIARPTFESINWDLVRRTSAGKLLGGRVETEAGLKDPPGIDSSRREGKRPRVFLNRRLSQPLQHFFFTAGARAADHVDEILLERDWSFTVTFQTYPFA